jgi:hypothetical protein
MPLPSDEVLYEKVKREINALYKKPSAFRSGAYVKEYKKQFKEKYGVSREPYKDDGKKKNLKRWFQEIWKEVGNKEYPVFRPTKRVSKDTPLTVNEISAANLKKQTALKQKIKGSKNLPPFQPK